MIVIYGSYRSRATRNIWLLEEIGLPWRLELVLQHYRPAAQAGGKGSLHTRAPAFLDRFPAGTIPVMEDGEVCLSESLAINIYLAQRYGGDLGWRTDADTAACLEWSFFAASSLEPAALQLSVLYQSAKPDPAGVSVCEADLSKPLNVLEHRMRNRPWIVGDRFTVADINVAEIVRYATVRYGLIERFPAVSAWLGRCHERPAFQRMWALRSSEPA